MAEARPVKEEAVRGLEPNGPGHDVLQHPVVVPLGDVDLPENRRKIPEEDIHVASFA